MRGVSILLAHGALLLALTVGTQPWAGDNGIVGVLIGGTGQGSRPVTLGFRDRPPKQLLAPVGGQETSRITAPGPGWWVVDAGESRRGRNKQQEVLGRERRGLGYGRRRVLL